MNCQSSDLLKIFDALTQAEEFFRKRDEMNGAVHLAKEIRFSPITSMVIAARERLENIMMEGSHGMEGASIQDSDGEGMG